MKLNYLLTGVIDGNYIEVEGAGNISQAQGQFDLKLEVIAAPKGWDPGIIILICCDNLRLFSAKSIGNSALSIARNGLSSLQFGSRVNSMREGTIVDTMGNAIVHMKAKGFLVSDDREIRSRTVIMQGFSHLDRFGGIDEILTPYYESITPTGPNTATGLSTYSLRCADGTQLTGHTTYPYVFNDGPSLKNPCTLRVNVAKTNSKEFHLSSAPPKIDVSIEEI